MKYPILVIFFVVIGWSLGHCELFDGWTWTDKSLYIAACAGLAADLYSTHMFREKDIPEKNKILGDEPDDRDLVLYGMAGAVAMYLMADWLRPDGIKSHGYRHAFLTIMALNGIRCARGNTIRCDLTWRI